jgi:excisionase family DNA binding protein
MLTVPEAAKRVGKDPETVRRWIRAGKLRSTKIGTQHLIDDADLDALRVEEDPSAAWPIEWTETISGEPPLSGARLVRASREGH